MFGIYSYLVYMLFFCGVAIAISWVVSFSFLKKHLNIILINSLLAVVFQLITDPIAEHYKAWFFSNDKILGIWIINFPIENILFFFLTIFTVSSCVLMFIDLFKVRKIQY